ncbi:hypothetical protein V8G54_013994 [Vigna mungo]|uniref:Aspergillus nuclease S1 n=1 Tax=Vigna mungo TaxID=3915 RepID=A0AAQ3NFW2_VIGMU
MGLKVPPKRGGGGSEKGLARDLSEAVEEEEESSSEMTQSTRTTKRGGGGSSRDDRSGRFGMGGSGTLILGYSPLISWESAEKVPKEFLKKLNEDLSSNAIISSSSSDNSIVSHDVLLFTYHGEYCFHVQIFDKNGVERLCLKETTQDKKGNDKSQLEKAQILSNHESPLCSIDLNVSYVAIPIVFWLKLIKKNAHISNGTPDNACSFQYSSKETAMIPMVWRICVASVVKNFTSQLMHYKEGTSNQRYNMTKALLFLSHFMGDIHQPMHVGFTTNKGGNTIKLRWFRHKFNLYHVRDREIILTALADYYHKDVSLLLQDI